MNYYLYILRSLKDDKLYIGVTKNLEKRVRGHNLGIVRSTKNRRPLVLVHREVYKTPSEVRKREWFLKNTPQGGKLKKKLVLVNGPSGPKGQRDPGPKRA